MKYYKSLDNRIWLGYEPNDKTGYIEISEQEWQEHLEEIHKCQQEQ